MERPIRGATSRASYEPGYSAPADSDRVGTTSITCAREELQPPPEIPSQTVMNAARILASKEPGISSVRIFSSPTHGTLHASAISLCEMVVGTVGPSRPRAGSTTLECPPRWHRATALAPNPGSAQDSTPKPISSSGHEKGPPRFARRTSFVWSTRPDSNRQRPAGLTASRTHTPLVGK